MQDPQRRGDIQPERDVRRGRARAVGGSIDSPSDAGEIDDPQERGDIQPEQDISGESDFGYEQSEGMRGGSSAATYGAGTVHNDMSRSVGVYDRAERTGTGNSMVIAIVLLVIIAGIIVVLLFI